MKNIATIAIVLLASYIPARAQSYDTVTGPNGRLPGYHYTEWYDTCDAYFDTSHSPYSYPTHPWHGRIYEIFYCPSASEWKLRPEYVDHPAAITGVGVWQTDTWLSPAFNPPRPYFNNPRVPEYVNIFKSFNDTILLFDSIRWDTATPKIYKIPYHFDTATYGFKYCLLYEVHLKTPILVDSQFYLAGTTNNNNIPLNDFMYRSKPTCYHSLQVNYGCGGTMRIRYFMTRDSIWGVFTHHNRSYGYVQPMIDYAMVHTLSADSSMGAAYPDCKLSKHVNQTIYAIPKSAYRFTWWNDGDTNNPRTVFITQDTTFTAYFSDRDYYHVTAKPDYPVRGHVDGSGIYFEGDTVTLTAIPNNTYQFLRWNDGNTSNPRKFIITQDSSFTARFTWPTEGISSPDSLNALFTLTPNPAHRTVTITINSQLSIPNSQFSFTLANASGQELLSLKVNQPTISVPLDKYPAGTYFVTIHSPQGSSTQKLTIQ